MPAASSHAQVASALPSCGATGAPQPSASAPCHVSSQVSSPKILENDPALVKENTSSNQHARASTAAASADHHSMLPGVGPTPAAPAPSSIQSPTSGSSTGATQPSAQYCTRLPSVVSDTSTPTSPLVSSNEILNVTKPSTSSSVIAREADQSPILPSRLAATPLMVTSGVINASDAVKSTLIDCPSLATPSGLEFFSCC